MKIDQAATALVTLVLWLGFASTISASAGDDSPPMVVLTGVLRSKSEWGPPGFGETPTLDSKVVIFALKLLEPRTATQLSLKEGRKKGQETFSEIQLWCDATAFPRCESLLKKSVGHRVTVSGEASRAVEPTDYLPVTLHVRLIANQ
jgi:hypothetical protein